MSRVSGSPHQPHGRLCPVHWGAATQHVENPKWKWGFAERMTEGLEDPRHLDVTRSWLTAGSSVKLQLEWPCCSPVAIS